MLNRCVFALSCAAWLASSAALAQPPTPTVSPLAVQAAPPSTVIRKQTHSFVQSYAAAPNPNVDQIGRWHDPVCVLILGLPLPDQAAKIKARIETMAAMLGLPAARADCRPNVEIAFEDDPQVAMDGVARRLEFLLGYYHLSRTKRLKTVTHPIEAWYVTATRSNGVNTAALMSSPTLFGLAATSSNVVDDPQNWPPAGCFNRSTACYTSLFYNVLIVADSKALDGKSLGLIADDMVMLALSQPKSLDGCNALPSVIDRFAKAPCPGRDPPEGLTPADTAYLTALYSADLEGRKRFEQSDIAGRMAKILVGANAVAAGASPTTANAKDR